VEDRKELELTTLNVDPSEFKSTTTRLLVAFTQNLCGAPELSSNNPALISATIISTTFAQSSEKLISLGESFEIQAVTKEILDKIKAVPTPAAKAVYEMHAPNAEAALKHSAELEQSEIQFKKTLTEERDKTIGALERILDTVSSVDNPDEKARSQEITNELKKLENTSTNLNNALDRLQNARQKSDDQLAKTATTLFNAMPPGREKQSVDITVLPTMRQQM